MFGFTLASAMERAPSHSPDKALQGPGGVWRFSEGSENVPLDNAQRTIDGLQQRVFHGPRPPVKWTHHWDRFGVGVRLDQLGREEPCATIPQSRHCSKNI